LIEKTKLKGYVPQQDNLSERKTPEIKKSLFTETSPIKSECFRDSDKNDIIEGRDMASGPSN
jgi:hypothetical protein